MSDTDDTAAAMAQAMGFSSFGSQNPPSKRRKFNPSTDAVVAASSSHTVPLYLQAADQDFGSGSNATPLGTRIQNHDEIDLDLEDDAQHITANDEVRSRDGQDDSGAGPGPQYLDTSRPSAPIAPGREDDIQSRIDGIVGTSTSGENDSHLSTPAPTPGRGLGNHRGRGGKQANRGQGHNSGHKWWEDYYDPSSITNPWERLEKTLGLKPGSDWVS
ncbi:hypothetical protein F5X99DRAFT_102489 [Biscogniauxia marginata]|nr:hypothetical protein F5X99DRAFT_102489 [Biscogniauxia marginata]